MGNSIFRFLCDSCRPDDHRDERKRRHAASHGASTLHADLLHFQATSQVPEGLSQHVVSSKKAQANWYEKLLMAWQETKPPPKTPEEVTRLVLATLKRHKKADVQGLLAFYGLPLSNDMADPSLAPTSKPESAKFELYTLPVDVHCIADGDTVTVWVDTSDPQEAGKMPLEVHEWAKMRAKARAAKNYQKADELRDKIVDAGYRFFSSSNGAEILARKYRIRLRGIDAPESSMPYGKEAKEELVWLIQGKRLKIYVYEDDRYGRCVGDVYCNGTFVQEHMLKKGCAWHYATYDQRASLARWEQEARNAQIGLWASKNPEKPWEWRREKRNGT